MVRHSHLDILKQGVNNWNSWREKNPANRVDLTNLDLKTNREMLNQICKEYHDQRPVIRNLNLSNANLANSHFSGAKFIECDFRGSDLSESELSECVFEKCYLAESEDEIEQRIKQRKGKLHLKDKFEFSDRATKLTNARAFGTIFTVTSMSFVDLTMLLVDEATRFDQVGVIGTRITRNLLDSLRENGGLTTGRLRRMFIVDDIATLRQSFSGIWKMIHFMAMALFLAPYLWFLGHQWVSARVGEVIPNPDRTSPIIVNLLRFIVSGGETWREWDFHIIPILLFSVAFFFNVVRGILVAKTIELDHQRTVQGHYPDFRLTGGWLITVYAYKLLGIVGLVVLVWHTGLFLWKPVSL